MSDALKELLSDAAPTARTAPTEELWQRGRRQRRVRRVGTAMSAVLLVAGVAVVGSAVVDGDSTSVSTDAPVDESTRTTVTTEPTAAPVDRALPGVTRVGIGGGIDATITRSDDPQVHFSGAPEDLAGVEVTVEGDRIEINRPVTNADDGPVKVSVTVSELDDLSLAGGVDATIDGFDDPNVDRSLAMSGGVVLDGDITARVLKVPAAGGVQVTLVGSVDKLDVDASGGTSMDLSGLVVQTAMFKASGGVFLEADVHEAVLSCAVSGGSTVRYGKPRHDPPTVTWSDTSNCGPG
jgi:hypothetical protein